ncbi:gliding motility-associated C-terminal domain-containing protein [Arsenicibacter rosenii]|uniref:Gliding motility-associated C-terminal domain-containing protein n=1 Tax=Arsenicibacter rosenii TaxID=1750698 RepID=A0A1S2VF86_9BACT|nr:gliding motility-associated C-terminal domain-containing protein [Arsenicibacter rosenii]OIN56866.1 hypothetical protein BLX24_23125 [Arsenicibacter rosenii]
MKKILVSCLIAASALLAERVYGQNGQYDLRITQKNINCTTQKAQVDLEIKASSATTSFLIGNANFRFQYDAKVFKKPVLVKQLNFSGSNDYGVQNLNGSQESAATGIVSLNIFYNGDGLKAQKVLTEWTPIATIEFDVDTKTTMPTEIVWLTDKSLPKTVMEEWLPSETGKGYVSTLAKSGGVYTNLAIESMNKVCSNAGGTTDLTVDEPLFVPEGFSPNGDMINDKFVIKNTKGLTVDLKVFNRYGAVVYTSDDYQNDWDGRGTTGQNLPDGTYFYTVKLSDGRKVTHYLTISR